MTSEYITKLKREVDGAVNNCSIFEINSHQTFSSHVIDYLHSRGLIVQEGFVQVPMEYLSQAVEYLSSCPDIMGPDSRCTADFFVSLALAEFEGSKAATQKKED